MSRLNDYVNWISEQPVEYDNFLALTSQPHLSPFGSNGNPAAMAAFSKGTEYRDSTSENPYMNPSPKDYNTTRRTKGANPKHIGKKATNNFYKRLFRTPEDILWGRSVAERQFNTLPSTSSPNDAVMFATWLNAENLVPKTASIYSKYGYPYTEDSLQGYPGQPVNEPESGNYAGHSYNLPMGFDAAPFTDNPNYGYGFGGLGDGAIPLNTGTSDNALVPIKEGRKGPIDYGAYN